MIPYHLHLAVPAIGSRPLGVATLALLATGAQWLMLFWR
jgi:hypothetical protein